MGVQNEPVQLRPLSIGEIFDRAVTLLVHNWVPLGIITIIGAGPTNLFDYLAAVQDRAWGALGALTVLLTLVASLATAAVVARIYRREPVEWRAALGCAFSLFLPAIGAKLTLGLIALVPLLIIAGIPAGLGVFKFANAADDLVAVLVILIGGAIAAATMFAGRYALNAMAIDGVRATDAVGRTLEIFGRNDVTRTMVFAVAQATLLFGGSLLAGLFAGFLAASLKNAALGTLAATLLMLILTALNNVVTSVFYFDLAIRREGYDIQAALDAMPS